MLGLFDCLDLGDDDTCTGIKRPADGCVVGTGDSAKSVSLGITWGWAGVLLPHKRHGLTAAHKHGLVNHLRHGLDAT